MPVNPSQMQVVSTNTLPETNSSAKVAPSQKEKENSLLVPPIFRCDGAVSFREGNSSSKTQMKDLHPTRLFSLHGPQQGPPKSWMSDKI